MFDLLVWVISKNPNFREIAISFRYLKDVWKVCGVILSIPKSHQHGNKLIEWQSFIWCILACHWREITILGEEIILMMNISYRNKYTLSKIIIINVIDNQQQSVLVTVIQLCVYLCLSEVKKTVHRHDFFILLIFTMPLKGIYLLMTKYIFNINDAEPHF